MPCSCSRRSVTGSAASSFPRAFSMAPTIGAIAGLRIGRIPQCPDAGAWVELPTYRSDGSEQLVLVAVGGGRGARGHVELGEDVADVPVHRLLAQRELCGDGLVGLARGDQAEHLQLARRESVRTVWGISPGKRIDARDVRRGAEPRELRPRRGELELAFVAVFERAAGKPDEDA